MRSKKKVKSNKLDLTKISGMACRILLVLYESQIKNIDLIEELRIGFASNLFTGKHLDNGFYNHSKLVKELLPPKCNYSVFISAFRYLKDKDFLRFDESVMSDDGYLFKNFQLTAKGIDIIENAKNNPLKIKEFSRTFNLNLSFNIDGILKVNNIVGVGGAISV